MASREDLVQIKTDLATSNSEKTFLHQTLQRLINFIPPKSVQQYPVVDRDGKPVSGVSIEKEEEKLDYEEEE